jgi:hypothetical protein
MNELEKIITEGNELEENEKYDLALEKFNLALDKAKGTDYDIGWIYVAIAEQYFYKKEYENSIKNLENAEKSYKSQNRYYINYQKGICFLRLGEHRKARLELLNSANVLKKEYENIKKNKDYINRMLDILKWLSKNEEDSREKIVNATEEELSKKYPKKINVFLNGVIFNEDSEFYILAYKRKIFGKASLIIYSNGKIEHDIEAFGNITKDKLIETLDLNKNKNWKYLELMELNDLCFDPYFEIKIKAGNDINYFIK